MRDSRKTVYTLLYLAVYGTTKYQDRSSGLFCSLTLALSLVRERG
jgi:hypothetical protein